MLGGDVRRRCQAMGRCARVSWRPTQLVVLVVVVGVAARTLLAGTIGLGVDESYMVSVARTLSLSYFDHPPLSFWIAGGVARLTGSERSVVVRLPFILLFAGSTWIMYRAGARLFGAWAGAYAALLLNLSPVFSISTGGWVLPDGPLMFFMLAAVYCMTRVLFPGDGSPPHAGWWLGAGLCGGFALLSKYHAIFLAAGALLFLLTSSEHRAWLRRPEPYAGAGLALALFLPVMIWNWQHGWVSFRFQGGRGVPVPGLHLRSLMQCIAGQAGYVLPWIWLPLVWLLVRGLWTRSREGREWLLCCLAAGPIAVFTLASLGGNAGLPHWEAPGYLLVFPLLGASVAARLGRGEVAVRRWLIASALAFVLLVVVAATHIATGWIARVAPALFTRGDPGLEALDWRDLGPELRARGLLGPHRFVAATSWIDAGKIAYALGPGVPVVCLCGAPHHFAFMYDQTDLLGQSAVLIQRAGHTNAGNVYTSYFETMQDLGTLPIRRGEQTALEVGLYFGRGFRRPFAGGTQ
jgi:dolichyl-phosphate-mannose-protein mannosyltransferase